MLPRLHRRQLRSPRPQRPGRLRHHRARREPLNRHPARFSRQAAAGQGGPVVVVGTPPPAALPLPSAGVHVLEAGSARFGIESADGRNAIFLTGRLHLDVADYLDYKPDSRFAAVQDLNSGVNARRARLGVVGRFMSDWDYTFIYDLGGSGDGFPPDPGALASGLENALVTYSGLKNHGVPLVFDLGYMDVPFGQAEATSSNDIPLVERAAISNVATNIMANDFRAAFGARSFTDRYWAGAYVTGPTSGTNHTTGEPLGAIGRAGYRSLPTRSKTSNMSTRRRCRARRLPIRGRLPARVQTSNGNHTRPVAQDARAPG